MYQVKPDGKGRFVLKDERGQVYTNPRTGKAERYSHSGAAARAAMLLNRKEQGR